MPLKFMRSLVFSSIWAQISCLRNCKREPKCFFKCFFWVFPNMLHNTLRLSVKISIFQMLSHEIEFSLVDFYVILGSKFNTYWLNVSGVSYKGWKKWENSGGKRIGHAQLVQTKLIVLQPEHRKHRDFLQANMYAPNLNAYMEDSIRFKNKSKN